MHASGMSQGVRYESAGSEPSMGSSKLATLGDPCNISHDRLPCMRTSYQCKAQKGEVDLVHLPGRRVMSAGRTWERRFRYARLSIPWSIIACMNPVLWFCRSIRLGHATTCEEGTMSLAWIASGLPQTLLQGWVGELARVQPAREHRMIGLLPTVPICFTSRETETYHAHHFCDASMI